MNLTQDQKLIYAAILLAISVVIWLVFGCLRTVPVALQSFLDFDKSVAFAAWTAVALILDLKGPNVPTGASPVTPTQTTSQ